MPAQAAPQFELILDEFLAIHQELYAKKRKANLERFIRLGLLL